MSPPRLPHFIQPQRDYIDSFLPAYESYLFTNNPNLDPHHLGTTKWVEAAVKKIIANELFASMNISAKLGSVAKAEEVIRTYYRNYRNTRYKNSLLAKTALSFNPQSRSSQPSSLPPSSPLSATPAIVSTSLPPPIINSLQEALRTFVVVDGDMNEKDLFFLLAPEAYQTCYDDISKSPSAQGLPACAISNKARKKAWDEADQEAWKTRKAQLEKDVNGNRQSFPKIMRATMQETLDRGILGSALVGVMYAFRTEFGLKHGIIYSGYNAEEKRELLHNPSSHSTLLKEWGTHANKFLPDVQSESRSCADWTTDDQGFPILPTVDLSTALTGQILDLMREYFELIWACSYPPSNQMPGLPWMLLTSSPEVYFDIKTFILPCPLIATSPPCALIHTLSLYDYLLNLQNAKIPFRFRSEADINRFLGEVLQDEVDEVEKGDDVLDEEVAVDMTGTLPMVLEPVPASFAIQPPPSSSLPASSVSGLGSSPPISSSPPPISVLFSWRPKSSTIALPSNGLTAPSTPSRLPAMTSTAKSITAPAAMSAPPKPTAQPAVVPVTTLPAHATPPIPVSTPAPLITPAPTTATGPAPVLLNTANLDNPSGASPIKKNTNTTKRKRSRKSELENLIPASSSEVPTEGSRSSKRARTSVSFGLQYAAGVLPPVSSRKPGWSYAPI